MGGQLATGSSIYMASAGVPAADGAGLSSIKSFSQLLTSIAAMPLAGGTFTGNVLFTDNTYDIGASGATRPRTVYAGTSVITPLLNNTNAAALTIGNSTYGVTVPGQATLGGAAGISAAYVSTRYPILMFNQSFDGVNYVVGQTGFSSQLFFDNQTGSLAYRYSGSKTAGQSADTTSGAFTINSSGNISIGGVTTFGNYIEFTGTNTPYIQASGGYLYTGVGGSARLRVGTDGIAVTGAAVVSGDISMQKATQGYIRAYATDGVKNVFLWHDGSVSRLSSSSGRMSLAAPTYVDLNPATGISYCFADGVNSEFWVCNSLGDKYTRLTHDGLSTSSGNLNLVPAGGTVAVTGSITASGVVSHGAYTVATLPSAGSNAGKMAQVTDSNVAASGNYGATVAAGGANRVKVFSDGTNWVIA